MLATFVVSNPNDSGAGSLRQAILDANGQVGADTIAFNIPGTLSRTISPTTPLPILAGAVTIDGTTQPGYASTPIIEIDGTNAGTDGTASGLRIQASNCVIRGLAINNFRQKGIDLASGNGNVIRGNFIGTDLSGTVSEGNSSDGIFVGTASSNTIGGVTPADRNVISGNKGAGIHFLFQTATSNVISGNYIGTDVSGQQALANGGNGIDFFAPAKFNTVGGTAAGAGNLISGNNGSGIAFFGGDSTDNLIAGNFIGTNAAGTAPVANRGKGVDNFGSPRITILNNLVSGNTDVGLNLGSDFQVAQGNKIGTDVTGTLPIGNQGSGISFGFGGKTNLIGGTQPGQGNIVAFNGRKGIAVTGDSQGVKILGNSIFANTNIGIDLKDDGVTPNTAGSPHTGPNLLQSFPVLTSATSGGAPAITGTLTSTPNSTFRVEFFASDTPDSTGYGEGKTFLGATDVATDSAGNATFVYFPAQAIPAGSVVAATATDPAGNTSEFSAVRPASALASGFLQFGAANYTVSESGGLATITVARIGGTSGAASVAYATLAGTATAGSDYNEATGTISFQDGEGGSKTFTVPILDDKRAEGGETVTLRLSSPSGAALGPAFNATLTIVDDDLPGVAITPTSGLVTTEAGGTATFTARLTSQPLADVTINLASGDSTEGKVDRTSLVFTPSNWDVPQVVTVTGLDDLIDDGDIGYAILTSAAQSGDPAYNGLAVPDVAATNRDDDTAGIVVTPTSGLTTTEAGGTATFTIRLATQPTANVSIPLASSKPNEGLADRTAVVFTPANWNVPQVVTVRGIDDNAVDGAVAYTITTAGAVGADPAYNGLDAPDVGVTNLDNDVAGIVVTPVAGLVTTELGGTASFSVRLNTRPTAPVAVAFSSSNAGEATVDRTLLVFTPANWNVPQAVTVVGVADDVVDGDVTLAIVTSPSASDDPSYAGLDPADVAVTNRNTDVAGVSFSPLGNLITTESGGTATFAARLNTRPSADVTIGFQSGDPGEGVVGTASLTFTPANWSTPQVVTITGVDDAFADGAVAYSILTTPAVSTDPLYDGLKAPDVLVVNADNDAAGVTISATGGLSTTEAGGSATFSVILNTQPVGNVEIALASSNLAEGTVDRPRLVFTPNNWNVPQVVTVVGADDAIDDGDVRYAIVTAITPGSDPAYAGLDVADVDVINTDDDAAGITVVALTGLETTGEGGTASFSVRLNSRPIAPVTIAFTSSNPLEGTVATPSLTFTPDDWATPQTVMVVGGAGGTGGGRASYTIAASASSADSVYGGMQVPDVGLTNLGVAAVQVREIRVATVKVKKAKGQTIVISLSDGLNASTAANLANYSLVSAGKDKKYGTKDDIRTALKSATYDPIARTITLAPKKTTALSGTSALRLTIVPGLLDRLNRPIDGDRDGLLGGEAVAIIRKKRVTYPSTP